MTAPQRTGRMRWRRQVLAQFVALAQIAAVLLTIHLMAVYHEPDPTWTCDTYYCMENGAAVLLLVAVVFLPLWIPVVGVVTAVACRFVSSATLAAVIGAWTGTPAAILLLYVWFQIK